MTEDNNLTTPSAETLVVSCARAVDYPEEPVAYLTCHPEEDGDTTLQFFACTRYDKQVPLRRQFWEPMRLAANILLGKEQLLGKMIVSGDDTHKVLAEFFATRAGHGLAWELKEENAQLKGENEGLKQTLGEIGEKLASAPRLTGDPK